MRKWPLVLAATVLTTTALAGCGAGKETDNPQTGGAPAAGGTDGKPVTIKLHSWYPEDQGNWSSMLAAFHQKYPNITVEHVALSEKGDANDAMKKLDLLAASGEPMDVVMFSNPAAMAQRVGVGMLEPLEPFMQKEGLKFADEYKVDTALDGKYFALPGKLIEWMILLNKDYLDEAGLPVPTEWTWTEFEEYAKKLSKGEGAQKRYGTYFHTWKEYATLHHANTPENGYIVNADGSQNIDNERVRASLDMRYRMESVDKTATPYFEVISQKLGYRDVYFGGKAAMLATGNWMVAEAGGSEKVPAKFKTVFAPYPKAAGQSESGYTSSGADYVAMAASSKNKDAAYTFMRWYTTEGMSAQGKFFSSWKKDDLDKAVEAILKNAKNPEMVDKDSLMNVLKNSKPVNLIVPPEYSLQQEKAYLAEVELLLTGKQDVATTIQKSVQKMNEIQAANKK